MKDLQRFAQKLQQDKALQEKLASVSDKQTYLSLAVHLASQSGYYFTIEQAESFIY